jgi:hypothetical protein
MTVADLIKFLTHYADPEAVVQTVRSRYDGNSDVLEDFAAVAYAAPGLAIICADDQYHRQQAESDWYYLATLEDDGKIIEAVN